MKHLHITFLLAVLMSMVGKGYSATYDIALPNADGVTIYYRFINDGSSLEVSCRYTYAGNYSGNVVIPETVNYSGKTYSVTSIGVDAFYGCSSLTSVTIPNSVKSIGSYAFWYCTSLTSFIIPNSVTSIGGDAFNGCSGLISMTIGNSVTSIGMYAFRYCTSLTSIIIPNSVTSIGDYAFQDCYSLTSINVEGGNTVYDSRGNCNAIIETSTNTLLTGCKNTIIPNSVTIIGPSAFYNCSGLASLTIPSSVTSIGHEAFEKCTSLTSVIIPNSVTSIGWNAFSGCNGLTSLTIGNSVTSIDDCAFLGCSGLTSVTIPNSVTSIGYDAFSGCNMQSVTIGSGVVKIYASAFYNNRPSKVIWLTNTPPTGYNNAAGIVNYVANEQYHFSGSCIRTVYPFLSSLFVVDGVKYVPVSPSDRTCDAIDCLYDDNVENIHVANTVINQGISLTVQQVQSYTFYNNPHIKHAQLNFNGKLGENVFNNCSNMETAVLGSGIISIGNSAFKGCSSLKGFVIPSEINILEDRVFDGCSSLDIIRIPENVTDIKNSVFCNCTSLKTIIIENRETVLNLGWNKNDDNNYGNPLFSDCPLDSVYIGGNIHYNTSSSSGYSPFYRNMSLRSIKISDKETEISENEFYGCKNLKNVRIGNGVETIGNWAFSGCSSLDYFSFGTAMKTIGNEAFSDCTAVTKLISKAAVPPTCGTQALDDINKWTCVLQVPQGTLAAYQAADQWKEFFFIEDTSTGISSLESTKCFDVYTVSGTKVRSKVNILDDLPSGIYVVNGRKVVIR